MYLMNLTDSGCYNPKAVLKYSCDLHSIRRHFLFNIYLLHQKKLSSGRMARRYRDSDSKELLQSALHKISPSHSKEFSTLGRRIILGKARWGSTLKIYGEFSFIFNYWECLEDVLSRN